MRTTVEIDGELLAEVVVLAALRGCSATRCLGFLNSSSVGSFGR